MIIPSAGEEDAARDVRVLHRVPSRPPRRLRSARRVASAQPLPASASREVDRLGVDPWWHTGPLPGCLFRPTTGFDVSDTELAHAKRLQEDWVRGRAVVVRGGDAGGRRTGALHRRTDRRAVHHPPHSGRSPVRGPAGAEVAPRPGDGAGPGTAAAALQHRAPVVATGDQSQPASDREPVGRARSAHRVRGRRAGRARGSGHAVGGRHGVGGSGGATGPRGRAVGRTTRRDAAPVAAAMATPEAHRRFWLADIAKWKPIIQGAGQYAD